VSIGIVYIGLLLFGVIYALLTGAFGWLSDLGASDVHVDASGHLDAGHFHPISGTTIATFITGFGGGGIVGHYLLQWSLISGLALASATGLLLAAAAFGVLELIFKQTQAGAEYEVAELVGREAEVITAIPEQGTGEVAYLARGQREKAPARSSGGAAIPKGRPVVIEKVMGQTLYVRPRE
jgi:membrane-bound ClpP family serine protease